MLEGGVGVIMGLGSQSSLLRAGTLEGVSSMCNGEPPSQVMRVPAPLVSNLRSQGKTERQNLVEDLGPGGFWGDERMAQQCQPAED